MESSGGNQVIGNIRYVLKLIAKQDKKLVPLCVMQNVVEKAFFAFYTVFIVKYVFNLIGNKGSFKEVSLFLGVMCLCQCIVYLLMRRYRYYEQVNTPKLFKTFYFSIYQKVQNTDIEKLENADFYDKYSRAISNARDSILSIMHIMSDAFGQLARLIVLVVIIITIDPLLLLFPIIPILNSCFVTVVRGKTEYRQRVELSPYERKSAYCKRIFYEKRYAAETRIYDIRNKILEMNNDVSDQMIGIKKKYGKSLVLYEIWDKLVIRIFLVVIACLYLIYKVKYKEGFSIGEFAGAMAAISNVSYCVAFFAFYLSDLVKNSIGCTDLIHFLEEGTNSLKEEVQRIDALEEIVIKNVGYQYPDTGKPAIRGIDISIHKGQKIAVVGFNGAGKSTLVKIVMGLQKKFDGDVLWNGVSIKDVPEEDYKAHMNVVLQNSCVFNVSIAENIRMGRENVEDDVIWSALEKVGMYDRVKKLEKGIHTIVGKEFSQDGVVFSGGEQQKIIMARIFANETADLIILDEPTSAMDPLSEYNIYQSIQKYLSHKTVIFISHRLTTCTMADSICLLKDGKLIEKGKHEELMDLKGEYYHMFQIQQDKYVGDENGSE